MKKIYATRNLVHQGRIITAGAEVPNTDKELREALLKRGDASEDLPQKAGSTPTADQQPE